MSRGPTGERTKDHAFREISFIEECREHVLKHTQAVPDGHQTIDGVCRAEIPPPVAPLGDSVNEADAVGADDAPNELVTDRMSNSTLPESKSSPAELISYSGDHSEISDIILCEPPRAHLAMLDLRLGSPLGRRSARRKASTAGATTHSGAANDAVAATCATVDAAPTGETPARTMPELPPRGEIARLGARRTGGLPQRIGSGALVPAKLTWAPKDPFGAGVRDKPVSRFRWELMLTAACVTAISGLAVVWLVKVVTA